MPTSSLATAADRTQLLILGRGADPTSERGTVCPGEVPAASDPSLVARARAAKEILGDSVFVLGHHYQRDEVIEFADARGDSFKLAQEAAANGADTIIFCGVHFMAETADILTDESTRVILPDLAAGCSMADMADIAQVERAWEDLRAAGVGPDHTVPMTYMNSTAAIKSFTGRNGGVVCTSSNAERAMEWAFEQGEQILFLPDEHLGRNTAVLDMGLSLDDCVVYNPHQPLGGLTAEQLRDAKVVLWKGHCSVHGTFTPAHVALARAKNPDVKLLVHPECRYEVVTQADEVGSTSYIIEAVRNAEPGTAWAIGTELNLVGRLAQEHPEQDIMFLNDNVCFCATMNRIDLPHLVWTLEELVQGRVVNEIRVDPDTRHWAKVALDRMLSLPGRSDRD
ncbi:Quinolinate synthetase [Euzebya pacifica]|uniref:Quinolinate synthase n=1 Tax=Euzebya pacifica TaxID=1608957 RepID=A0A346XXL3_9ACTN|nr:quinolinate synthase NadA [Euzebya pacifica]AXV06960.1 Quinolinate synthetase [Euzebya pacifica]